jgi:hypothetical protein
MFEILHNFPGRHLPGIMRASCMRALTRGQRHVVNVSVPPNRGFRSTCPARLRVGSVQLFQATNQHYAALARSAWFFDLAAGSHMPCRDLEQSRAASCFVERPVYSQGG